MAINQSQYVNINSVVGASNIVPQRQLIARMFTDNVRLPPQTYLEFQNAQQVGAYFGTSSQEYLRALFYFSFISKQGFIPQLISFSRWVDTAVAPMIFGAIVPNQAVGNWTSITSGSFGLTIAGNAYTFGGLNFSSAGSLSAVATIVQTAINNAGIILETGTLNETITVTGLNDTSGLLVGMQVSGTGIQAGTTIASIVSISSITLSLAATVSASETLTFTNPILADATVTFTNGAFNFVGGVTGTATISVQAGTSGTDISGNTSYVASGTFSLLAWLPASQFVMSSSGFMTYTPGAITAPGSDVETITATLNTSANASNNFGTFAFMPQTPLTLTQNIEAATWNNTAPNNVLYAFHIPVTSANATTWANTSTGLGSIGGCALTLSNISGQYPEMLPMAITAATNYNAVNSVQNYEFQQIAGLTPSVTDTATALAMNAINVNYYGQTQSAGAQISFYQQGVMMGLAVNPRDMNVYANEMWLKNVMAASILTAFLNLNEIPANAQGVSQILNILQPNINQALANGVIEVGKTLTQQQIAYITQITGDENAWYQVQNSGYWINCEIIATGSPPTYSAVYTLVYSKNDVIRFVQGYHDLI